MSSYILTSKPRGGLTFLGFFFLHLFGLAEGKRSRFCRKHLAGRPTGRPHLSPSGFGSVLGEKSFSDRPQRKLTGRRTRATNRKRFRGTTNDAAETAWSLFSSVEGRQNACLVFLGTDGDRKLSLHEKRMRGTSEPRPINRVTPSPPPPPSQYRLQSARLPNVQSLIARRLAIWRLSQYFSLFQC